MRRGVSRRGGVYAFAGVKALQYALDGVGVQMRSRGSGGGEGGLQDFGPPPAKMALFEGGLQDFGPPPAPGAGMSGGRAGGWLRKEGGRGLI